LLGAEISMNWTLKKSWARRSTHEAR